MHADWLAAHLLEKESAVTLAVAASVEQTTRDVQQQVRGQYAEEYDHKLQEGEST